MNKWIMTALVAAPLAAAPAASRAEFVKVSLWGGYTSVLMQEVTDQTKVAVGGSGTVTAQNNGFIVGGDAAIITAPFMMLGLRVEHLQANLMEVKAGSLTTQSTGTLTPIMAGLNFKLGIPLSGMAVIAGVHGGYGIASMSVGDFGLGYPVGFAGGGFVGEASLGLEMELIPLLSFRVMGAYRYAPISNLEAKVGTATVGIKDIFGKDVPADFSGFNAVAGLALGF